MQKFNANPTWVLGSLWRYRSLVGKLAWREILGRYRGSVLGIVWSFVNPILMLIVYTFVFTTVFRMRWGAGPESTSDFALMAFVGMTVHGVLAEALTKGPGLIVSNPSYVKKFVFPLESLAWTLVTGALFHAALSFAIVIGAVLLLHGTMHPTILLVPVVLLPLILISVGITWLLASLGVFIRDIGQITGVLSTILLFVSPVFFPVNAFPEQFRALLYFNPLTPTIEQAREVMLRGTFPDWRTWLLMLAIGLATAAAGLAWFQKSRKGFADVI